MCGLNGLFAYNASASAPSRRELIATRDHMCARGPDGLGEWWTSDRRLAFGHRRLAIVDLSERGNQPMESADGRLVVVFNGEIYNYRQLRGELTALGTSFKSASDTEVLLHLYHRHGPDMVRRLRGMFAFAIWDNEKRGLLLARDPYGIKPLYTANDGWTFRFASQVKALLAGGRVSRDPESAGMVGFCLWGSVPEPFTLYREIRALPAGHTQWIDQAGPRAPEPYASITQVLATSARDPRPASEVSGRIGNEVLDSVRAHLIADVEVGLFLSAGVDSGALLGLMRDAGQEKVRAITLAFEEFRGSAEDEAPLAAEVARHYGAEHFVRTVSEHEFHVDLPAILDTMDQPSIDGVNMWFVSKAAREVGLKVALSGLGGDELLAGYPSFRDIPRWVKFLATPSAIPGAGRTARVLLGALGWSAHEPKALSLLEYGGTYPGAYLLRRGLFLPAELKTVLDPDLVRHGLRRLDPLKRLHASMNPTPASPIARVSALESSNYMRNQLLRDADWASMAHSLEVRTPLVDFELLKAVAPIVPQLKEALGKSALANAPAKPLPLTITNRTKTGFAVPTGRWGTAVAPGARKGVASRAWARDVLARTMVDSATSRLRAAM